MKLENLVMPLFFGAIATGVASGINKETIKSGMEAAATYLAVVPIGVAVGYVLDRFDELMKRMGYDLSGGCPRP